MKDIKSMIIGFLLATCMFLFMGQRYSPDDMKNIAIDKENRDKEKAEYNLKLEELKPLGETIANALSEIDFSPLNDNGKYQVSTTTMGGTDIVVTILDTETGEIFKNERMSKMNMFELIDEINK